MSKPPLTSIAETAHNLLQTAQTDPSVAAELTQANNLRWTTAEDMRVLRAMQPHLPQLPDPEVFGVYDEIREAEIRLAAPGMRAVDYREGTARYQGEVVVIGSGSLLLTAEHATEPPRKRGFGADHGTAGLAAAVAHKGVESIIPVGRQATNAVSDPEHPVKQMLLSLLVPGRAGCISLHGMAANKPTDLRDITGVHAFVGLGAYAPRIATLEAVEQSIAQIRDELGLRVEVGNWTDYLQFEPNPDWNGVDFRDLSDTVLYEGGRPATNRLEAVAKNTVVNYVIEQTADSPALAEVPVLQLELCRSVRLTPDDLYPRDRSRAAMGVYLGYRLLSVFVENMNDQQQTATL